MLGRRAAVQLFHRTPRRTGAGWYAGAAVTGAYGATAKRGPAPAAAGAAAKAWAVAIVVSA